MSDWSLFLLAYGGIGLVLGWWGVGVAKRFLGRIEPPAPHIFHPGNVEGD